MNGSFLFKDPLCKRGVRWGRGREERESKRGEPPQMRYAQLLGEGAFLLRFGECKYFTQVKYLLRQTVFSKTVWCGVLPSRPEGCLLLLHQRYNPIHRHKRTAKFRLTGLLLCFFSVLSDRSITSEHQKGQNPPAQSRFASLRQEADHRTKPFFQKRFGATNISLA